MEVIFLKAAPLFGMMLCFYAITLSCVHCRDFTLVVSYMYFFISRNYEYIEEKQIPMLILLLKEKTKKDEA